MALNDVPGLGAYIQRSQMNDAAPTQELQQAGALTQLMAQMQAQQSQAKVKGILEHPGTTPEQKIAALLQLGPAGATAAHQYAGALKDLATTKLTQGMGTLDMNDPAAMLKASLVPGMAHLAPAADRLAKQQESAATLATMREAPQGLPAGAVVPGTSQQTVQPIPPEDRAAFERVASGAATSATPQLGDPKTVSGGHQTLAVLMQSEIPAIAKHARAMQTSLNQSGNAIPATVWEQRIESLARLEAAQLQAKSMAQGRTDNRPLTTLAKLKADLDAGRISQVDYDAAVKKQTGIAEVDLSPEAIDQGAARYNIDGSLPPNLGRGTQGAVNTAKILNKAAALAVESGDSAEAARVKQISGKASTQALGQLVKQKNLILAFEKNAVMNAELVLQASEQVDRLGSPIIDRWIQAGKKNIAGDVAVAKLDTAMRTFVNEYARITTSVTGGGVTSDTARREIDQLLQGAHTKEQVREVVGLMKQEMANRRNGYEQQEAELKRSFTGAPAPAEPAQTAAPAAVSIEDRLKKYK